MVLPTSEGLPRVCTPEKSLYLKILKAYCLEEASQKRLFAPGIATAGWLGA